MNLSIKEAFMRGFAQELADRGVTPSSLVKAALTGSEVASTVGSGIGSAAGGIGQVATTGSKLLAALAIGLPAAVGGTLGYYSTLPEQVEQADIDAMREQDLIENYRRAAEDLKARQARFARKV